MLNIDIDPITILDFSIFDIDISSLNRNSEKIVKNYRYLRKKNVDIDIDPIPSRIVFQNRYPKYLLQLVSSVISPNPSS